MSHHSPEKELQQKVTWRKSSEKRQRSRKSKEQKNMTKGVKAMNEDLVCTKYCNVYSRWNDTLTPVKHLRQMILIPPCSFLRLKDTTQCLMNHAKMAAIKDGFLGNSNKQCLHVRFAGPEHCISDSISLTHNAQLAAGKYCFYTISSSLQVTGKR